MQNLGNVYICGFPFVMSRTDGQNGLHMIFKNQITLQYVHIWILKFMGKKS
jgi:hypothetical protein